MILIVMGVSGSGKTTIGELLARRLKCGFSDADIFHSEANKNKMARAIPLNDADRRPWLAAIRAAMAEARAAHGTHVFACSALKRCYRDMLRGKDTDVTFVYLKGSFSLLRQRLHHRRGHFFDPSLLRDQLDTLEEPGPDEAITVGIEAAPEQIVDAVLARISACAPAPSRARPGASVRT